jgi:MtN3 and saliva related transmembrane protein
MWLICFSGGVFLWFVYGVYYHSLPIILANAATFFLIVPIVVVKVRQPKATANAGSE